MKTFMIILTLQLFNCISYGQSITKNDGASSPGRSKRPTNNYYHHNIRLAPIPSPFGFNYFMEYLQPPLRPHAPKIEIQTPRVYPKVHRKDVNSILKQLYAKFNRILKPLESKTRVHRTRKPVHLRYNFNANPSIQKAKEMDSSNLKKSNEFEQITEVKSNKKLPPMDKKHETNDMFVKTNAQQSINDKHHNVKNYTLQSDLTNHDSNGYFLKPVPEIVKNEVTRQLEAILRNDQFDSTNESKIFKSNKPNDSIDNKKNITTNVDDDETKTKVVAKSIFGNFVGNKHFANIFVFYPNTDGESLFVKLTEKLIQDSDVDENKTVSYKENIQIDAKKEKNIINNDKDENNTVTDTVDTIYRNKDFNDNGRSDNITKERDVNRVAFTTESIIETPTETSNEELQDSDIDKNVSASYEENSEIAAEIEKTIINDSKDVNNTGTDTVNKIHQNEDFKENDRSSDTTKERDLELVEFTTESIIETPIEKPNEEKQDSDVNINVSDSYEESSQISVEKEKTIINNSKDENNTVTDIVDTIYRNKDFNDNGRSDNITKERDVNRVAFTTESIIEAPTETSNEELQDSDIDKNVSVSYKENSEIAAEIEKTIINNSKDVNNTGTDTANKIHQNKDFKENDRSSNTTKERDLELVEFTTESIIETPIEKPNEEKQDSDVNINVSDSYEESSQISVEKEKTIINNSKDENNTVSDTDEINQNEDFTENDRSGNITKERDITNETTGMDKLFTTETVTSTKDDVETTRNTIEMQTEESPVSSSEITTEYSEASNTIELTESSDESTIETTNTGIEKVDDDKSNIETSTETSDIETIISENVL